MAWDYGNPAATNEGGITIQVVGHAGGNAPTLSTQVNGVWNTVPGLFSSSGCTFNKVNMAVATAELHEPIVKAYGGNRKNKCVNSDQIRELSPPTPYLWNNLSTTFASQRYSAINESTNDDGSAGMPNASRS